MELLCTNCGFDIDARTANVHTNLVQCPKCYTIHKIDVLLDTQEYLKEKPTKDFFEESPTANSIFDNHKYELKTINSRFEGNFEPIPPNSKIDIFSTSTSLEINIPTHGFEPADLFLIVFASFWLIFVGFWTFFASMASILFALFSIPFWLVGIGMASGLISKFTEKQFIELDRYTLTVTKTSLFSKQIYEIDVDDIHAIIPEKTTSKSIFKNIKMSAGRNNTKKNKLLPTIKSRNFDLNILEFVSKSEQNWGIRVLKQGISKFSERKV